VLANSGEKHGVDFLMKAIAVMFLFHINLHLIPGLFTGINLSYLLWPPNGTVMLNSHVSPVMSHRTC
jgi:hypothetical protein